MANPIHSIKDSGIPKVSRDDFLLKAKSGDLVFCSGNVWISRKIESETNSIFSHVLQLNNDNNYWLALESTFEHGTGVARFGDYLYDYPGEIVLTRRPRLTDLEIIAVRQKFYEIIDTPYNWRTEVGMACHNILKVLPVINPKNEYYCSASQWYASQAASPPLQRPSELYLPTPEDNWEDPTVEPICYFSLS